MEICITKESRVEEGFGHLKPPNNWEAKGRDPIGCAESGRHVEGTTAIETGDAFLFKPGEPHQLINTSDQDMVI